MWTCEFLFVNSAIKQLRWQSTYVLCVHSCNFYIFIERILCICINIYKKYWEWIKVISDFHNHHGVLQANDKSNNSPQGGPRQRAEALAALTSAFNPANNVCIGVHNYIL